MMRGVLAWCAFLLKYVSTKPVSEMNILPASPRSHRRSLANRRAAMAQLGMAIPLVNQSVPCIL